MAVSERGRRELQEALVSAIGPDPTDTLFSYLPPVGWADVATKRDLDAFGAALRGEIQRLDGKVDALVGHLEGQLHHELHKQDRWLLGMTITIVFALFAQTLALIGQHFLG